MPDFDIQKKLKSFYDNNKIPHLLFHGTALYEKEHIASQFIHKIYQMDMQQLKFNVLVVNCCGKGIKFIRDEIKTFAKMHMFQNHVPVSFKTVLLLNTDFITEDAQSALRRSIELFSYNTRFFILVENKNKLLKPILSRFCEIHVGKSAKLDTKLLLPHALILKCLGEPLEALAKQPPVKLLQVAHRLVESGLASQHLMQYFESLPQVSREHKVHTLFMYHKWKADYRCEKLFLLTLLDFFLFRSYEDLKSMCLM